MKKIFLILCMFLCIGNVSASTHYSDYSDFSDWNIDYIEEDDKTFVETKTLHKYYREEISGEYFLEGENNSNYPIVDYNNYYYSDYSEYGLEYPLVKPNRDIETIGGYKYQEATKVKYIVFDNIHGSYGSLRITEIGIKDSKGNNIEYLAICNNCNIQFLDYINNGIYKENESYIENGGSLVLELYDYYSYDDIYLSMGIFDVTNETKTYNISFYPNLESDKLLYINVSDNFTNDYYKDTPIYNYDYTNMVKGNITFSEPKISLDEILPTESTNVESVSLYRYRDKYYYYYKVDKYYSDFMEYGNDEYPIESDEFITYFRYKRRDKAIIEDNITITNYNVNLQDYIESSTDFSIATDIDVTKNGVYYVQYILPYEVVRKEIVVNIEENNLKEENQRLIDEYNNLLTQYEETLSMLEDLERVNQNNNNEYQKLSELFVELQNRYNELQNVIDDLNNDLLFEQDRYNELLSLYEETLYNLNDLERINQNNNNEYQKLSELFVDLQNKYKELQLVVNNLNNDLTNSNNNYDRLLINYNEALSIINNLNNQIEKQNREYQDLSNLYVTLQNHYQNLENAMEVLTNDLDSTEIEKDKLLDDYNNALDIIKELNAKISEQEKIKDEYNTLLTKYEEMQNKLAELNNSMNNTNDIKKYNMMIEELNNYKIQINELNMELEKYKNSLEQKEEEKNKMSKEFENELINIKLKNENKIKEMQKEIENRNEVKTIPLLNISNIPFIIIFIIFIIIALIVLISLKKKYNN